MKHSRRLTSGLDLKVGQQEPQTEQSQYRIPTGKTKQVAHGRVVQVERPRVG